MSEKKAQYALVTVPLALNGYTYRIPPGMEAGPGSLVRVQLGKTRYYNGVVTAVSDQAPQGGFVIKDIAELLVPGLVSGQQLELWHWLAFYYHCSLGEVLKAALPACLLANTYHGLSDTWYDLASGDGARLSAPAAAVLERLGVQHPQRRADLLEHAGASSLQTLVKHGYIAELSLSRSRFDARLSATADIRLTEAQTEAFGAVKRGFEQGKPVLLHGVASSGKTEIYMQLVRDCIARGKKALVLVPEIALTTQLAHRFEAVFGDSFIAYHSKLSDEERSEIYCDLAGGNRFKVVLGVRSALFLPWHDLGLLVIDEEQESSYKQFEPAPRYHARHAGLMLAHGLKVPVLLGSATPSVESYWLAKSGRYVLVSLTERYAASPNPEMVVVDREEAFKKNLMKGMFSWDLLEAVKEAEQKGGQILLFQNRRGFSSSVVCPTCGWTPVCPNCGISLNRHRSGSSVCCHYCGYREPEPKQCPKCGAADLKDKGYGTERVVEEFRQLFPQLSVERLDVDSTSRKNAYAEILQRFAEGRTRVLVGTQMIAKGLDFAGVSLVGVVNADNLLSLPDFRAAERAFQLLVQVAGRAGRRGEQGKVVLQASSVDAEVLDAVKNYDYARFFERQIEERRDFHYPPFVRIVRLELRHRDAVELERIAQQLGRTLRNVYGDAAVLGPEEPLVGKIRSFYLRQVILKWELDRDLNQAKQRLNACIARWNQSYPALRVVVDVDPV